MEIRNLEKKDLLDCLKLLKQLTVSDNNFDYEKVFTEISNDSKYTILVATIENRIVGMSTIFIEQKLIHSGGKVGHIEDVVVDSNYRNLGIGKKLIEKCVSIGQKEKCYKIILDCDKNNVPFYEKNNFHEYGVCMKIIF